MSSTVRKLPQNPPEGSVLSFPSGSDAARCQTQRAITIAGSHIYLSTLCGKRKHLVTYPFVDNLNARVLNLLHISETYVLVLGRPYDGQGRREPGS